VGRTFQVATPFLSMSVGENLLCARLAAAGEGAMWRRAATRHGAEIAGLLDQVGLAGRAEEDAAGLAYGDRKRLDLALALAGRPKLLLMDEPTAGMAPAERAALMRLGFALARERGLAVLFTEHDMEVVFGHADRVIVLDRGRIIARGTPEEIRADAQVQTVYLGTRPAPEAGA
jgi:branched-chain amino acid transport system ATP-binding protein